MHQGNISIDGNTYMVMICNKDIHDFPNPRKIRVDVVNNWLYKEGVPTPGNLSLEKGDPDFSNHCVGHCSTTYPSYLT